MFLGTKSTRHLLAPMALMLMGSLRIRLSGVMTTQRLFPHEANQTSSASSRLKYESWILTMKPAISNCPANCLLPKLRSRKKIVGSGCWSVAYYLFNLTYL